MKNKIFAALSFLFGVVAGIITFLIVREGIPYYIHMHQPGWGSIGDTIFLNHSTTPSVAWILVFGIPALLFGILSIRKRPLSLWSLFGLVLGSASLLMLLVLYLLYSFFW